jgi:hypothetical protein
LLFFNDHQVDLIKVGVLVLSWMITISTLSYRLMIYNRLKTLKEL